MAEFRITSPDGQTYVIEAPDAATAKELVKARTGQAQNVPPGMVFDPQRNYYIDTEAAVQRERERNPGPQRVQDLAAQTFRGFMGVGSRLDEWAAPDTEKMGLPPELGEELIRSRVRTFEDSNPIQSTTAQIGGGLLSALPVAGIAPVAAPTASLGRKVAQGSLLGGTLGGLEGGIYAAGDAEPGDNVAQEAEKGAITGTAIGTLLGLGGPLVGRLAGGLYRGVKDLASSTAPATRKAGLDEVTANALAPVLEADQASMVQNFARLGPEARLMDAGQNTRRLAELIAKAPGPGANTVRMASDERITVGADDLKRYMESVLGAGQSTRAAFKEIATQTAPKREAAYSTFYATPIDYSAAPGKRIEEVLATVPPNVLKRAIDNANLSLATERLMGDAPDGVQIMAKIDGGRVTFERMPGARELDAIKRELAGIAETATDNTGKITPEGRNYRTLARELRAAIAEAAVDPETGAKTYEPALAAGLDKIEQELGAKLGRDILKPSIDPDDFAADIAAMTETARQRAREAAKKAMDRLVGRARMALNDEARDPKDAMTLVGELSKPETIEKLTALVGRDSAAELVAKADSLRGMLATRQQLVYGSSTEPLAQARKALEAQVDSSNMRQVGGPAEEAMRLVNAMLKRSPADQDMLRRDMYQDLARALIARADDPSIATAAQTIAAKPQADHLARAQSKALEEQVTRALLASGLPASYQITGQR